LFGNQFAAGAYAQQAAMPVVGFLSNASPALHALLIMPDVFFTTRAEQLAAMSLRYSVPAIYEYRPFAAAGGLVSYEPDEVEYYRCQCPTATGWSCG